MGPTADGGKWSDVFGGVPPESLRLHQPVQKDPRYDSVLKQMLQGENLDPADAKLMGEELKKRGSHPSVKALQNELAEGVAPIKAAAKKGGKWGKIAKGAGKYWWALPFALEGAGYVKDAVKKGFGVGEKFFDGKSALDEFLGQKRQEQAYDDHQRKRAEALQQLKVQNRMRMMQVAPHLAQSLLAGRELPEDAVVIGGKPRVDLLDQVAEGMSNGAFQQGM